MTWKAGEPLKLTNASFNGENPASPYELTVIAVEDISALSILPT